MIGYIILFGLIIWVGLYIGGWAFAQRLIQEDKKK